MPISNFSDEQIFPLLNFVLIGYLLLVFFPRWSYTHTLTLCISFIYSLLYLLLVIDYVHKNRSKLDTIDFSSLTGVINLFQDASAVMGGWTHYIAFDLMIARYIVFDAMEENIYHLIIIPLIPLTLMLGPIGLFSYLVLKTCKNSISYLSILKKFNIDIAMYGFVSFLSFFMVIWIVVFPATVYLSIPSMADSHRQTISEVLYDPAFPERIPVLLTKYHSQPLIACLHFLPSGLWAFLIPFQLYSPLRKNYPIIHRWCGYLLFSTVPLIIAGVVVIFMKKLNFEYDFPNDLRKSNFSEWGLSPFSDSFLAAKIYMMLVGIYFCFSAIIALQYAMIQHNYHLHKVWIIRHISSGLWVAAHRMYFISRQGTTPSQQKAAFYDAEIIAPIVSIIMAELYIYFRMKSTSSSSSSSSSSVMKAKPNQNHSKKD